MRFLSKKKKEARCRKRDENFDHIFYKTLYNDLNKLNDEELYKHWLLYGKKESRFSRLEDFLSYYKIDKSFCDNFDFNFYIQYYDDLPEKIKTKYQAIEHYLKYGKNENRHTNISSLMQMSNKEHKELLSIINFDLELLQKIKNINSFDVTPQDLLAILKGEKLQIVKINKDDRISSKTYLRIAEYYILKNDFYKADIFLDMALLLDSKNFRAIELKANIMKNLQNFSSAIYLYEQVLKVDKGNEWVYINLIESYQKIDNYKKVIESCFRAIKNVPSSSDNFLNKLNKYVMKYFEMEKSKSSVMNFRREELVKNMNAVVLFIYNVFKKLYGMDSLIKNYNSINQNKILIIGDFHIEQCVRYRINQKIEQLELQNYLVKTFDWTQLQKYQNEIPFYDIVIFYRVPATIEIIKTIAQVNALNKISIYEIDDLLFEYVYPDKIESYGGNVALDTYHSLIHGMAMFNSIAKLCTYGVASTIPLQKKLANIVSSQQCLLHRNGLDSLSSFEKIDKTTKKTIDIFYGSGTLAHNQDFIDLVLPAVDELMEKYSKVRLIIVGHLTLPKIFLNTHKERVVKLPKVGIKAYYSYLKQADINIAVLHKDTITDCKSELKWFEAACFSIPSVVCNTQNYIDVIKNADDAFIADTPEAWYASLEKLLDPKIRERIAENALKRIQKEYSLETLGSSLSSNLNELVIKNFTTHAKRKKIALVNVFFPPQSIGGATRVVSDNFDELIESYSDNYEVCVFTSDAACLKPYNISMYNYKGVRVYKSTILYREHMDWHPKDENMYKIFMKFLEIEQPDKVHFHCVQRLTASVVEATKDKKIPYIITAHDAWWISDHQFLVDKNGTVYQDGHPDPFYERVLPDNITLTMSIERENYLKELLYSAESVLTVSESFAKLYAKNGIKEIGVTKNGISKYTKWLPKDTRYSQKIICGHIGGMSAHKGYYILKEAVKNLQLTNVELLVVDHSKKENYEVSSQWGSTTVNFIGRQSQERVVELYRKIDVLFAPSIWPESFGLVTREAQACGCWIVASNLGGIGEDVTNENGFVISPTVAELEKVLKTIDKNSKKYKGNAKIGKIRFVDEQLKELERYL